MRQLNDFSDDRLKGSCIHCGGGLDGGKTSREHVPTRSLLDKPYPKNLPTFDVHHECNAEFSLDEEYLVAFLASVLSGSTEPDPIQLPTATRALERSSSLRKRIDQSKRVQGSLWGSPEVQWTPEIVRVNRVIVKNARGHAYYELGEPMLAEPSWVGVSPMSLLSPSQREEFENGTNSSLWPEVGSRLMQRVALGDVEPGGWITVQPHIYRYAVSQGVDEVLVRLVLRDYLAAEVLWGDSVSHEESEVETLLEAPCSPLRGPDVDHLTKGHRG